MVTLASLLGIGVLGLPYVFAQLGWALSLGLLMLFGMGSIYAGLLLCRLYLRVGTPRVYADLGMAAYGARGYWAVMVVGYTYLAGTLMALHLTAAMSLKSVMVGAGTNLCQLICSGIVAGIMLAAMQIRSLHELTWTAIVGVISIGCPLIILVARLLHSPDPDAHTEVVAQDVSLISAGTALMNIVFAFAGQVIFVELMHEMRQPEDFPKAVYSSTGLMMGVYSTIASIGYLCLGAAVVSPITDALPNDHHQNDGWLCIVNAFLFTHVIMAYTISANVMNTALLARFAPWAHDDNGPAATGVWFGITVGTLLTAFGISTMIPFLNDLMGFVGASCGMATTYIFPCLFAIKLLDDEPAWERGVQYVLLVLAVGVSCLGVYSTVSDMADKIAGTSLFGDVCGDSISA